MFPSNLGKPTNFPNMAGRKDCDEFIARELEHAGIPLEKHSATGEVPYHVIGRLGNFTFERAWYYWMVAGDVPLEIAVEMFNDPLGHRDVRVVGYGGNTDPNKWAVYRDEKGDEYGPRCAAEHEEPEEKQTWYKNGYNGTKLTGRPDLSVKRGYIQSYHIDSQEGLDYFVATLKKHGVIA